MISGAFGRKVEKIWGFMQFPEIPKLNRHMQQFLEHGLVDQINFKLNEIRTTQVAQGTYLNPHRFPHQ